jgi:hypothetical protein
VETLRACSNGGFLRPIDRKNPEFRLFLEPARSNFGVCNAKIQDFKQALSASGGSSGQSVRLIGCFFASFSSALIRFISSLEGFGPTCTVDGVRACLRCGFLRSIDRKNPDFRLFWSLQGRILAFATPKFKILNRL